MHTIDINLPELRNGRLIMDVNGKRVDVTDYVDALFDVSHDDEIPFTDCDCCCDGCCACDEMDGFEVGEDFDDCDPPCWGVPDIDRVIFNPPATVVFWTDGTKTVVKAMEGEKFERYAGFIAACAKKMFGSTSRAKAIMEECAYDQPKSAKKAKQDVYVPDLTQALNEVIANHESAQEAINEALAR